MQVIASIIFDLKFPLKFPLNPSLEGFKAKIAQLISGAKVGSIFDAKVDIVLS